MTDPLAERIEAVLGRRPAGIVPLSGGGTGAVWRVDLADGTKLVAQTGDGDAAGWRAGWRNMACEGVAPA